MTDEKATRLAEAAREKGLRVEELLEQLTDDFLSRSTGANGDAFRKALTESVSENAELLRRLAK
jgi:hypothetical protein